MKHRSFLEILLALEELPSQSNNKVKTMAEALAWGYRTSRTAYILEKRLYSDEDLLPLIQTLADDWDGEGYLSGALSAAHRYIRNHG